ncbi:MAG: addiction module protein [Candidatus Methylacidiphilales bacterium]
MRITLDISDANSIKATPLIEYLKSLDFVSIISENDYVVPDWHQQIVEDRLANSNSAKLLDWNEVKDTFKLDNNE